MHLRQKSIAKFIIIFWGICLSIVFSQTTYAADTANTSTKVWLSVDQQRGGNANGFYFKASPIDELTSSENWKIRYYGCVYVDGKLNERIPVIKVLRDLYYVGLADAGLSATIGETEVVLKGEITDGTHTVEFWPVMFKYHTDATWQREAYVEKTGVKGDANGDGTFSVTDIVRIKYIQEMGNDGNRRCSEDALYQTALGKYTFNLNKLYELALTRTGSLPVYLDDEYIQLGAYEGPKNKGTTVYENGVAIGKLDKERTLEDFQLFADAGLNTLIEDACHVSVDGGGEYNLMGSGGGHWKILTQYMEMAEAANLDVIVSSEALNSYLKGVQATRADGVTKVDVTNEFLKRDLRQLLTGMVQTGSGEYRIAKGMLDYNNFKGIMMGDEITFNNTGVYAVAHRILAELAPNVETFNSQLSGVDSATGISYAEMFGPIAGNFCYDYYPFLKDNTLREKWLHNLQLSAKAGKTYGFPTGITIQSLGQVVPPYPSSDLRVPTEKDDIGFQVYTSLAYGMKYINYYTYSPPRNQNEKHYYAGTMIEYDQNQNIVVTDTYRAVQAVNLELLDFDHVFLDYDWLGTILIPVNNRDFLFDNLDDTYEDSNIIAYSASEDAIIGCMYDPEKELKGYWIVNVVNPQDNASNTVAVELKDATKLLVYKPAQNTYGEVIELSDGKYTANLGSGEGQFVILLK